MKIFISHSRDFDFENELYKPLKNSSLNLINAFFFPHEDGRNVNTQEKIKYSDLILAEVSFPSTGQGIELGWATGFGVHIICVSKEGAVISSALKYVTTDFITYSDKEDLVNKLTNFLKK